ncbi:hypothetical protein [Ekhidna sp.]
MNLDVANYSGKFEEFNFIQTVYTNINDKGDTGFFKYLDNDPGTSVPPFTLNRSSRHSLRYWKKYRSSKSGFTMRFYDSPVRRHDFVYWRAETSLMGRTADGIWKRISTIYWGFNRYNGHTKPIGPIITTPSEFHNQQLPKK